MDSGIEKSLCNSCHHDIIYEKINFSVPLPPPYFRTIWDYKNADVGFIQRVIENFNWQYAFESKTINEKVQVLRSIYFRKQDDSYFRIGVVSQVPMR